MAAKKVGELIKEARTEAGLTQEQLAHILLPLGGLTKAEVRRIAEEQGFLNAHKII